MLQVAHQILVLEGSFLDMMIRSGLEYTACEFQNTD
jgi:hypothetical protein